MKVPESKALYTGVQVLAMMSGVPMQNMMIYIIIMLLLALQMPCDAVSF